MQKKTILEQNIKAKRLNFKTKKKISNETIVVSVVVFGVEYKQNGKAFI